jgi:hypothetical protein
MAGRNGTTSKSRRSALSFFKPEPPLVCSRPARVKWRLGGSSFLIFKSLSREEFEQLSVDQRMEYLHRLMTDLRQKLADTRKQQEAMHKALPKS